MTTIDIPTGDGMALLLDPILGEVECGYAHLRAMLRTDTGLVARLTSGQATLITEL